MTDRDQILSRYSESIKRGCPTCDALDSKSCSRCYGKTHICHWFLTKSGYAHYSHLSKEERELVDANEMPKRLEKP